MARMPDELLIYCFEAHNSRKWNPNRIFYTRNKITNYATKLAFLLICRSMVIRLIKFVSNHARYLRTRIETSQMVWEELVRGMGSTYRETPSDTPTSAEKADH